MPLPRYRLYVEDSQGQINFKGESLAVWENTSKSGKTYLAGKLEDGRRFQLWPVAAKRPEPEDTPF